MTGVTGARRGVGEAAMSADSTVIETELLLRIVKCYCHNPSPSQSKSESKVKSPSLKSKL